MNALRSNIEVAAKELANAARPLILVGPEGAGVVDGALRIADLLGAAVLTTPDALSVVDGARSAGVFSFGASPHARRVVEQADVVLALSALGEFTCRLGEAFVHHRVIQLHEQATHDGPSRGHRVVLGGKVASSVRLLLTALRACISSQRALWTSRLPALSAEVSTARDGLIHPAAAIRAIQQALPERVRVCLDVTSGALHAYQRLSVSRAQRVFSSIENSACMGEALMASIGIRLASGLPTLALVGDWCHCITPPEIHTAVELQLSAYVVVVWANGGGAFIGAGVEQQGIEVPEAVWRWRSPPNFAQVARSYGAVGLSVSDADSLAREVASALRGARPVVIEAKIDPDVAVPAGDRFLTLGEARRA